MAAYVVDVEGLADADGDECLAAEALDGEGHAARRDVPDRPERLEDPHPLYLSPSGSFSRVWLRRRRGGRAGGEGFRVGLGRRKRRQSGGGRRGDGG